MALSTDAFQTIIIVYVFTWLSEILMAVRLFMRRYQGQKWDVSDHITMVCMVLLIARMSLLHVMLVWGSNNVTAAYRKTHVFGLEEIYRRTVGSKLTLVNRTVYNTYIWLQKCVVMILYKRMLSGLPWAPIVLNVYWGILVATYIVIQVVTFTDCRPVHLYWQVIPNAGTCSQALGQLIILGALNIATDLMLIFLPMPTLLRLKRSRSQRLRIASLFSIGFFLVAITIIRLPLNFAHRTAQVNRTTWASVEAFGAAFVANVPTLFTLRRKSPNVSSGAKKGSDPRTRSSRDGWRHMGSRSQVDVQDDGDKDMVLNQYSVEEMENKGIVVRRSVELTVISTHEQFVPVMSSQSVK